VKYIKGREGEEREREWERERGRERERERESPSSTKVPRIALKRPAQNGSLRSEWPTERC